MSARPQPLLVLGLTGPPAVGKNEVMRQLRSIFEDRGAQVSQFSLSDEIRDEIARMDAAAERTSMRKVANDYRQQFGADVWARRVTRRIQDELTAESGTPFIPRLFLVDAIRNPSEVREFQRSFDDRFRLLAVTAPIELILDNLRQRNRSDEDRSALVDLDSVQALVDKEMGVGQPEYGNQIAQCVQMANWPPLENDGSLAEFQDKVRRFALEELVPLLFGDSRAPDAVTRSTSRGDPGPHRAD
jgi:dephospho-CoA kinase